MMLVAMGCYCICLVGPHPIVRRLDAISNIYQKSHKLTVINLQFMAVKTYLTQTYVLFRPVHSELLFPTQSHDGQGNARPPSPPHSTCVCKFSSNLALILCTVTILTNLLPYFPVTYSLILLL